MRLFIITCLLIWGFGSSSHVFEESGENKYIRNSHHNSNNNNKNAKNMGNTGNGVGTDSHDNDNDDNDDDYVTVASSCSVLSDGLQYIQPMSDNVAIPVICNNGFAMIDASLSFELITENYFTSVKGYGDEADRIVYAPDCSESVSWRDWFLPATDDTKFLFSYGCTGECSLSSDGSLSDYNGAYYVTTGYLCPAHNAENNCETNETLIAGFDEFEKENNEVYCSMCDDTSGMCGEGDAYDQKKTTEGLWCDCWSLHMNADFVPTYTSHDDLCVGTGGAVMVKPAIVKDRSQCTCYADSDDSEVSYYRMLRSDLPSVDSTYKDEIIESGINIDNNIIWAEETEDTTISNTCPEENYYYLTNDDFKDGTLRITECGSYVLTEDIIFNFNAPSEDVMNDATFSPNRYDIDDLYWFPTNEQASNGDYFGLTQFYGPYALGFFAGITVETDFVTIDLNGYTMSMDPIFYLQQRFFTLITLSNKPFQTRQGPTNFGILEEAEPRTLVVKNGVLGLSSHHGIHGRDSSDVQILNVRIKDFDVTGIQCNGCMELLIKDCIIGPQNTNIPTLGRFTQARALLPRVRYLVENYGDSEVTFANRNNVATTIEELADELVEQMDMVYDYVVNGVDFDSYFKENKDKMVINGENTDLLNEQIQWEKAKSLFLNDDGWQDGGSSYGIVINGEGTAVVCIGRRIHHTADVTIENVEIFGIAVEPREKAWTSGDHTLVRGFMFDTMDEFNENMSDEDGYYIGTAFSDIVFAANKVMQSADDECVYGDLYFTTALDEWIFVSDDSSSAGEGHTLTRVENDHHIMYSCGSDIQSHVSKGAIGLRVDGSQELSLSNINIHDITNWGKLGMDKCGQYDHTEMEEGVAADPDIQYGYTGTSSHGMLLAYANGTMENITISNVESFNGRAVGIGVYKGTEIEFLGDFEIDTIIAGSQLKQTKLDEMTLPNANPFVCGIYVGDMTWDPTNDYPSLIGREFNVITHTDNIGSVTTSNMYGDDSCTKDRRIGHLKVDGIGYDWTRTKQNNDNNGELENIDINININDNDESLEGMKFVSIKHDDGASIMSNNLIFNVNWNVDFKDGIFLVEFIMTILGILGIIVLFLARIYSNKLEQKQIGYKIIKN